MSGKESQLIRLIYILFVIRGGLRGLIARWLKSHAADYVNSIGLGELGCLKMLKEGFLT